MELLNITEKLLEFVKIIIFNKYIMSNSENNNGYHKNSEMGCRGCESGTNVGSHCSACPTRKARNATRRVHHSKPKRRPKTPSPRSNSNSNSEDNEGWHKNSEMGCRGCESGTNVGSHCTACREGKGIKKSRGRKSRGRKSRGRKSRGRKSTTRKSRGRKSRGRKSKRR